MITYNFIKQHFIQIYTILDMSFYDLERKNFSICLCQLIYFHLFKYVWHFIEMLRIKIFFNL